MKKSSHPKHKAPRKGKSSDLSKYPLPSPNLTYKGKYEPLTSPRSRAFAAKAAMRRKGWSITRAAEEFETTPSTIRKQFPGQFRKRGGRWQVLKADRDLRTIPILTSDGYRDVKIRGSKQAGRLGRLNWAQGNFIRGEDPEGRFLLEFEGKKFGGRTAITDLEELTHLGDEGEIRVNDLGSDQIARGGQ